MFSQRSRLGLVFMGVLGAAACGRIMTKACARGAAKAAARPAQPGPVTAPSVPDRSALKTEGLQLKVDGMGSVLMTGKVTNTAAVTLDRAEFKIVYNGETRTVILKRMLPGEWRDLTEAVSTNPGRGPLGARYTLDLVSATWDAP